MHLNVRFSNETGMKQFLDFLYQKSAEGMAFTGLLEAMVNDTTIVTAVHNIKSNKGSNTAGVDEKKMNDYLQMPKADFIELIQSNFSNYKPKPARRVYIPKSNGKQRPLGIPTVLDRIIQECVRIIIEPICEARFTRTVMVSAPIGHKSTLSGISSMSSMREAGLKIRLCGRWKVISRDALIISTIVFC